MTTRTRRSPEAIAREYISRLPNAARWLALNFKANLPVDMANNTSVKRWIAANVGDVLVLTQHVADEVAVPTGTPESSVAVSPKTARETVLEAFYRLDQNGYNQVSIADLASDTCLPLPVLHAAIQALRWENILTAYALEGRHGITRYERETAIIEHGEMLGLVSLCQ